MWFSQYERPADSVSKLMSVINAAAASDLAMRRKSYQPLASDCSSLMSIRCVGGCLQPLYIFGSDCFHHVDKRMGCDRFHEG